MSDAAPNIQIYILWNGGKILFNVPSNLPTDDFFQQVKAAIPFPTAPMAANGYHFILTDVLHNHVYMQKRIYEKHEEDPAQPKLPPGRVLTMADKSFRLPRASLSDGAPTPATYLISFFFPGG